MKLLGYRAPVVKLEHRNFHNYMEDRKYRSVSPHKEWGIRDAKYYQVTDEDATMIKILYPDVEQLDWAKDVEPAYDDEVKVMCRDCNGYLFSVSGWEWLENKDLQYYECLQKNNMQCPYEKNSEVYKL
jgi:hypothetical protein